VLALYGVALVSGILAAALESIKYWFSLVLVPLVIISLALLIAYLGGLKVASGSIEEGRNKPLTRIMLELTFRRRLLEVVLDLFLIGLAYYLAFLISFDLSVDESRLSLYLRTLPVALGGTYISFFLLGVYRGVWRYVDFSDLARYFLAAAGSVLLISGVVYGAGALHLVDWGEGYTLRLFMLYGVFLLLGLAASRSSFRILDLVSRPRLQPSEARVLIYGAGDGGEMALRWILMNPQLKLRPVGFLDDDPFMHGRQIHGVDVLGGPEVLAGIIERRQIDGVILAVADPTCRAARGVVETCQENGCWVRSLRLEFEPVA
jgi:UDP-GlcNAc:undecaprenyl-phosphate/decaprenyl-phosphate GlcNAc-1-phosphate transferase